MTEATNVLLRGIASLNGVPSIQGTRPINELPLLYSRSSFCRPRYHNAQ